MGHGFTSFILIQEEDMHIDHQEKLHAQRFNTRSQYTLA